MMVLSEWLAFGLVDCVFLPCFLSFPTPNPYTGHVVAMKWDAKVSDRAANIFAEFFCECLMNDGMKRRKQHTYHIHTQTTLT